MRVLVGCEESGTVRDAFAARGHDAWSNDLIPARNGGKHLQKCVKKAIVEDGPWDIIILHPDCTALTVAGNSTYGRGMPKNHMRFEAIEWTVDLWNLAKKHAKKGAALENPVGVLPPDRMGKPTYIHPWQFGHPEQKKTCIWLDRLPALIETNNVYAYMMTLPKREREREKSLHVTGAEQEARQIENLPRNSRRYGRTMGRHNPQGGPP